MDFIGLLQVINPLSSLTLLMIIHFRIVVLGGIRGLRRAIYIPHNQDHHAFQFDQGSLLTQQNYQQHSFSLSDVCCLCDPVQESSKQVLEKNGIWTRVFCFLRKGGKLFNFIYFNKKHIDSNILLCKQKVKSYISNAYHSTL